MTFVYLDTETTGLNPLVHQVWEIAFAKDDEPVQSAIVPHGLATADQDALAIGSYWERTEGAHVKAGFDLWVRDVLSGATLVGANPAFDAAFLQQRWGCWGNAPWRYRMVDVEAMAYQAFGWDRPKGLKDIAREFLLRGVNVPNPDHSAAADVETTRACHKALLGLAVSS